MTVGGWQRPQYYGRDGVSAAACIAAEVRAVRESVGLIDVSTLGKSKSSARTPALSSIASTPAASGICAWARRVTVLMLDEAGIVRDDGVIARLGAQHFYFTTTTSGAAAVYRELLLWNARWRMDCTFVNATGHRAAFNIAGPASRAALQPLTDIDLSEAAFPALGAREGKVAGMPARIMRAGFVSSLGFEIHVPYPRRAPRVGCVDEHHPATARLRCRSAARAAAREGPRHRRAGHRRADQSLRSRAGLGGTHGETVLHRPAQPAHPCGTRRAPATHRLPARR